MSYFFSVFLFAMRGHIPDIVSIPLANGLLILGADLLYQGSQRFFAQPIARWPWAILLLAEAFLFYWTLWPDDRWRAITICLSCAFIQLNHFVLVWHHDRQTLIARFLLLTLALSTSADSKLFDPNPYQAIYLLTQAILNFLLSLNVFFLGQQMIFAELSKLSLKDPLTGALNRRALMQQGQREFERQRRSQPRSRCCS
ncbi:hypothetical protein GWK36_04655 [Caldichromatium japonicum]|uniref:GGDEF domain-containing protein n=1 Tax=Caldichromatium japonicum TaxID=2699430 RepID=A0A6G7VBV8_9GAMM|nr:hypothetical protein [Caldichromatium japonicum]QIK37390.1 hypothetical protein GWK36_04655 [Caldichromatium japonicum]